MNKFIKQIVESFFDKYGKSLSKTQDIVDNNIINTFNNAFYPKVGDLLYYSKEVGYTTIKNGNPIAICVIEKGELDDSARCMALHDIETVGKNGISHRTILFGGSKEQNANLPLTHYPLIPKGVSTSFIGETGSFEKDIDGEYSTNILMQHNSSVSPYKAAESVKKYYVNIFTRNKKGALICEKMTQGDWYLPTIKELLLAKKHIRELQVDNTGYFSEYSKKEFLDNGHLSSTLGSKVKNTVLATFQFFHPRYRLHEVNADIKNQDNRYLRIRPFIKYKVSITL